MAIKGLAGAFYNINGASTAFTNEATTGDAAHKVYRITDLSKRFADKNVPVIVNINGSAVSVGYSIDYAGLYVTFNNNLLSSDVVTLSGNYLTVTENINFFEWTLNVDIDTKAVTTFASNGWNEYLATSKSFQIDANGYFASTADSKTVGSNQVVVLYVDESGKTRYEGYAVCNKCSIGTKFDDIVTEALNYQGTGKLSYRED